MINSWGTDLSITYFMLIWNVVGLVWIIKTCVEWGNRK